jgi:hypothetical protein
MRKKFKFSFHLILTVFSRFKHFTHKKTMTKNIMTFRSRWLETCECVSARLNGTSRQAEQSRKRGKKMRIEIGRSGENEEARVISKQT